MTLEEELKILITEWVYADGMNIDKDIEFLVKQVLLIFTTAIKNAPYPSRSFYTTDKWEYIEKQRQLIEGHISS